ncbi:hypothetical protein EDB19DRAFT_1643011, partial [Suillus lakei]
HKPACHEDKYTSGIHKFVQMFSVNPFLMAMLRLAVVSECRLLDNPRVGFDVPFMACIKFSFEPSNFLDFIGLYLDDRAVEEKLQGMLQVNAITAWDPSTIPPHMLYFWRVARARCNAEGLANDPVGLVEFVCRSRAEDPVTFDLHIPTFTVNVVRTNEPLESVCTIMGTRIEKPICVKSCLE